MKSVLEKYKIPLIRGGILLSIVILLFTISFINLRQNADKGKTELEAISGADTIKDDQIQKSDQAPEDNQAEKNEQIEEDKITEINEKNKNIDEKDGDIDNLKDPANKKDKNTYASKDDKNTKVKKEAAPTQAKDVSTNPSTNVAGESYTVRKGDTLFLIAQRFGISVDHLMKLNGLYSDIIYENQVLKTGGTIDNSTYQTVSRGGTRSDDLYWLSRIIHSEAGGESYLGKVAVGNVIINRVNSSLFPDTIKDVVFDRQNGHVQFSPVLDGSIYNAPGGDSVRAAGESLAGSRPVGNALYFLNPRDSTNFWIVNNRKYMTTIGLHDFYY